MVQAHQQLGRCTPQIAWDWAPQSQEAGVWTRCFKSHCLASCLVGDKWLGPLHVQPFLITCLAECCKQCRGRDPGQSDTFPDHGRGSAPAAAACLAKQGAGWAPGSLHGLMLHLCTSIAGCCCYARACCMRSAPGSALDTWQHSVCWPQIPVMQHRRPDGATIAIVALLPFEACEAR